MLRRALLVVLCLTGCSTPVPQPEPEPGGNDAGDATDASVSVDAGADDAGVDAGLDAGLYDAGSKADACASTFGASFTNAFGRADGTVVAVVPPGWAGCALPNSDHVVIQLAIDGGVQRLVVNVKSNFGDPNIRMRALDAPLSGPTWGEGWHPGEQLDYPTMGLHSDGGWDVVTMDEATRRLVEAIPLGAPLSVFATSSGGATAASAHLVHRNGNLHDGAIVIDPTGPSPHWLLFHFADQTF